MIEEKSKYLIQNLFILDNYLRAPLLNVRMLSYSIAGFNLVELGQEAFKSLEDFNQI